MSCVVRLAGLEPAAHGLGKINANASAGKHLIYKPHILAIHPTASHNTLQFDTTIAKDSQRQNALDQDVAVHHRVDRNADNG